MSTLTTMKDEIIKLISDEISQLKTASTNGEKLDRINNILQIKLNSEIDELKSDIYIDVKNFINYYIIALEEKKYFYDEFDSNKINDYLKLFELKQKCSLLKFTIRHLKIMGFEDKIKEFELALHKNEFLIEWKNFGIKNFFKVIYLATVYNYITILSALALCFILKAVIYLPAPAGWPVLFDLHYYKLNDNKFLNHLGNILLSIFDVQELPSFVTPLNIWGSVLYVLGKCFFILIVINILIDQLTKRFKF